MKRTFRGFEDLLVWQLSHKLALKIYHATQKFPNEEQFGLTNQVRRAAVSTTANIAEGSKRATTRDLMHFLSIASASNAEVKNFLILARDLGFLSIPGYTDCYALADRIGALLYNLRRSLR